MVNVKITGVAAARRAFARLTRDVHEAQEDVAEKWAEHTERGAQARVPLDTGNLGSAIESRVKGEGADADAQVGVWEDDAFYGQFVEFGTEKQVAQPFLYPAATEANREVPRWTAEAINERLP
jgi:HK97 gp10 family phage protein